MKVLVQSTDDQRKKGIYKSKGMLLKTDYSHDRVIKKQINLRQ